MGVSMLSLVAWAALVLVGLFQGWWLERLAPPGETRAFMDAIVAEVESADLW